MSSTNHRSTSTHSSRRARAAAQSTSTRSLSVPARQFVIILTNNRRLLREVESENEEREQSPNNVSVRNRATPNRGEREEMLSALLQVELRDATLDYLSRTHRSFPIQYVFDMSDIDATHQ